MDFFFRPCVHCVVVMKMRMWSFDCHKIDFDRITFFFFKLILAAFTLWGRQFVKSLLPQFIVDLFFNKP